MKKKLRKKFLPFNYVRTLYYRFPNLQQDLSKNNLQEGNKSVDEYIKEFYPLMARNELLKHEEQVARFVWGLRESLQDALNLHVFWYVSEAYQHALIIEKQQNRTS